MPGRRRRATATPTVALALLVAVAGWGAAPPLAASPWTESNHVRIDVSATDDPTHLSYEVWISTNGDTRIHMAGEEPGKKHSRDLLLLGGQLLAAKGDAFEAGAEVDALDGVALEWQLVARILERAAPGGPPAKPGTIPIAVEERQVPIEVATAGTAGTYPAPWSAAGSATRDANGPVRYEIDFRFTPPDAKQPTPPTHLAGFCEKLGVAPTIPDSFSLDGWRLYRLGPVKQQTPEGEKLEYAATPLPTGPKTVGELRQQIKKD